MGADAITAVEGLHWIDNAIILVYMVGVFVLGSYFGKYVNTAEDFFSSGKTLPWWAIGMSIVVTDISATDFIATAGAGYVYGISAANFDLIGSMPAMVFSAFIFVPYYWRSGVFSIPEFLGRRYNSAVQIIHGSIWGVFLLVMMSVMLWLTAVTLQTIVGWNPYVSTWAIVLITGLYTLSGGLTAVVMTDVVQMFVMFVGGIALLWLSMWEVGGWSGLQEKIHAMGPQYADHFTMLLPHDTTTPYPWTGIIFGLGLVMATGYMCGNPTIVQRALGAQSEWDAKGGMLFAGLLKVFIPMMIIVPGLAAVVLEPGLKNGDQAVPSMIRDLLPPGLKGLMFAALFAALMSSVSSYLNTATTIWTTDLYGKIRYLITGKTIPDKQVLAIGRVFTIIFMLVAAIFAPYLANQKTMYNFIQTSLSMFQGPVFAILLLGIMWHRTNRWGGLAGMLLGVVFTTILTLTDGIFRSSEPFLFVAWWSFVFSIVVTVVVSLLTPPEPEEKIRGLVFGQVLKDGEIQRVLRGRISE